jgi:hypothetical protein
MTLAMSQVQAISLLMEPQAWQSDERFVFGPKREPRLLVMRDNHTVLQRASGGNGGYRREPRGSLARAEPAPQAPCRSPIGNGAVRTGRAPRG